MINNIYLINSVEFALPFEAYKYYYELYATWFKTRNQKASIEPTIKRNSVEINSGHLYADVYDYNKKNNTLNKFWLYMD